jgi:hypothetical protein
MVVQYSEEVQASIAKATNLMLDHARAIGELCMSWAALDNAIDELLIPLLDCDRGTIASLVSSMEKTEARVNAIKRIMVHADLDLDWREWVNSLLGRIMAELAPMRHRYVHDRWQFRRGEVQRIEKRALIRKAQSRQPDKLFFDATNVTPVADVDRIRAYVDTVLFGLEIAQDDLEWWRKTGRLRRPRELWIPLGRPKTRMAHFPTFVAWKEGQPPPFEFVTDP